MQNPPEANDLSKYLQVFLHRKWFILVPSVVLGVVMTAGSVMLPDVFRSTTLILVTPQRVPEKIVASTVTTDLQDRLSTITQQILSRTALEKVIEEFMLFSKEKASGLAPEEIIELMRRKIWISVDRGARRNEAFEVGYSDSEPRIAQAVTNRLAGLFIEENLKVREQQAAGTSQFLAGEIERYKGEVREKELAIYEFKRRNMNELTEQQASNQARLTQLQSQLQINSQTMNSAKDRKVLVQQQLAEIEKRVQEERERAAGEAEARRQRAKEDGESGTVSADPRAPLASERELAARREELSRLRLTQTDRHPDVVRLASRVRQLEAEVSQELARGDAGRTGAEGKKGVRPARGANGGNEGVLPGYPPVYEQLKLDSQKADIEIARMARENEQIQRSIEVYQGRIGAAPARELQMKQLSEGYSNVKAVLDSLTDKKLQADLSENMERKQKGEQFRVLDPANLPERPTSPNRLRLVAGGFGGGAALGFGLVFLLDFAIPGIRTREDLEALVGFPVLGVIPEIVTPSDLLRRKRLWLWGGCAAAVVTVAASLVVHIGVKPLPEAISTFVHRAQKTYWTTAAVSKPKG